MLLASRLFGGKVTSAKLHLCWLFIGMALLMPYRPAMISEPPLPAVPRESMVYAPVSQATYIAQDLLATWSGFRDEPFLITAQQALGAQATQAQPSVATPIEAQVPVTASPARIDISLQQILVAIWAAGAAFFAMFFTLRHLRFVRAIKRHSIEITCGAAFGALRLIRCHLGIRRKVRLAICPIITVPVMHGLFRPTISLPYRDVDEEQLHLMLLHEALHIKRGDIFARLICLGALTIHWFNPLVHIMNRKALEEQEKACDDAVILHAGSQNRAMYSQTLLDAAKHSVDHSPVLSFSLTSGGKKMKDRLANIMFRARPKRWVLVSFTAIMLSIVMTFGLVGCGETARDEAFVWPQSIDGQSPFYGETLTIAVMFDGLTLNFNTLARGYMQQNPGVTIEVINLADFSLDAADLESARDRIGLELMAGTAPTLIDNFFAADFGLTTLVDYMHPATARHFADWLPIIAADPYFNEDEWYMHVFEALTRDGRLLGFPIAYDLRAGSTYVLANATIPELVEEFRGRETITLTEMLEIHSRIAPTLDRPMYLESRFDVFTAVEQRIDDFFDFETGRVEFATPEFIDFITHAREITSPWRTPNVGMFDPINFGDLGNRQVDAFESQNYLFRRTWTIDFHIFSIADEDIPFVYPVFLTNDHGEMLLRPYNTMLLNATATDTQKALAMDFLRFSMASNFALITRHPGVSLNASNIRLNNSWTQYWASASFTLPRWRDWQLTEGRYRTIDDIIIPNVEAAAQMPMRDGRYAPEVVREIIREAMHQFHDGLITAEQAANDLQNRIALVIMEL